VKAPSRLVAVLPPALLAVLLAAGSVLCLGALDRLERGDGGDEKLYVPSGRFLREASLGFRELAADGLWLQTTQYYGGYRRGDHDLDYFRGLLDAVCRLDPRFVEAYRFGSLVLAMDLRDRAGAVDLLKRGIRDNPDTWLLPFEVGFVHYVLDRDYRRAAAWFDAAARAPDATDFARRFAAFCHKRAGEVAVSLVLWRNLYDTTSNPAMRDLAERMIADCEERLREGPAAPRPEGI
jgi:hypothetical protein